MSGTLGNGKTFFIQYLTKYYMLLKNKVIFIATFIYNAKDMFSHYKNCVEFKFSKKLIPSLLMKCQ